jgi:hypothetical protein
MFQQLAGEEIEMEDVGSDWSDSETLTAAEDKQAAAAAEEMYTGRRSRWVDDYACGSICALILDDRHAAWGCRRRPLPPSLYAEQIAPFLRFDSPLPNMLYVFGGRSHPDILRTVEMFDTWNGRWAQCPPMPTARAGCAAAALPDGRIIVVGGYDTHGIVAGLLASCDVYDPVKQCWEKEGTVPRLLRARWGHGCASLNGRIYAVGGCSLQRDAQPQETFMETLRCCEVYTPESPGDAKSGCTIGKGKWQSIPPLQVPRSGSRVVALQPCGGERARYLAAVGGCDDIFGRAETQPTVELFDEKLSQWFVLPRHLQHPRTTAAVAAVGTRRILVVGGAPSLQSAESFEVSLTDEDSAAEAHTIEKVPDLPEGRMGCQAALLTLPAKGAAYPLSNNRCVAIVGGERCSESGDIAERSKQFATVPVFDLSLGLWREDIIPPMCTQRTAVAICVGSGLVASCQKARCDPE